jgi:hypothetical protein
MGNKNGTYDTLMQETKELLMERTGKKIYSAYEIEFCFCEYNIPPSSKYDS